MSLYQTLRIALRALLRNTMRSFLTVLGIVIGVAAVIAMMAIGAGARAQIESAFAAMGTNLLIILPGSATSGGQRGGFGSMPTLTVDDLSAIRAELSNVKAAAPVSRSNQSIISEEQNWSTSVLGTTPEYFAVRNWAVVHGITFSQTDVDTGSKVIVLGQTVVDRLYGPNGDAIGQSVRIGNVPYQVIGVMAKKGQSATGQDYDDAAFVPFSTFTQKIQGGLGKYIQGSIFVQSLSSEGTPRLLSDITTLLRDRHHLLANQEDDFSIRNLSEVANAEQQGTQTLTALLASVAAVSLLVGGIGVMNIMLVSVTERTREIGLRMAIGAKPHHIMMQFLAESLVLGLVGGVLGIAFGVGVGMYLADRFRWPMLVPPGVIGFSSGFSGLVGVVFGLYPARKAAALNPIEAIRHE